jgi:metal-sulfur cluster biosynthetic enzyme
LLAHRGGATIVAMRRFVIVCALVSIACGSEPRPSTETPEPTPTPTPTPEPEPTPTQAVDVAAPAEQGGVAIHRDIIDAVRNAKGVDKFKLRVDENGTLVKQSLYHVDESRVPEPVKALAAKEFAGSKPKKYELEVYSDVGLVYEVEVQTKDGKQCEVSANAEGVLRYKECHIKPKELPKEVAAKVKEAHPKGKIVEVETKQGPDIDEITIEVQEAGKEFYVRIKPDGTVIQTLVRVPAVLEVPLQ